MLEVSTELVGRIVDGKFCLKVGSNNNIFDAKSPQIIRLEKELEDAQRAHEELKEEHILVHFRNEMAEFEKAYGTKPTRVLMNFNNIYSLCKAYNKEVESMVLEPGEKRPERVYSSDDERVIDGIKVKSGCDQDIGQYRIYSFE
jgi:hypothetical protein